MILSNEIDKNHYYTNKYIVRGQLPMVEKSWFSSRGQPCHDQDSNLGFRGHNAKY